MRKTIVSTMSAFAVAGMVSASVVGAGPALAAPEPTPAPAAPVTETAPNAEEIFIPPADKCDQYIGNAIFCLLQATVRTLSAD